MPPTRAEHISPFLVMEVLERAQALERAGHDVIHLEIGEPDFPTPKGIAEAGIDAIRRGETHYTHSLGVLPLREAIAAHYRKRYGVSFSPEQVIVTMGTSPALLLVLFAILNAGDEVILCDPGYACYPNFVRALDGKPVVVPVFPEDGFVLDPKRVKEKIGPRTKAIIVNSPSNPTGCVLPADVLKEIANLGIRVISDEIYHGLVYGEREHTLLEFTDRAFVLGGFSKFYAMTGWRLGYLIAPPEFVRPIQKLQQNLFISPSSIAQRAGVAALTGDHPELAQMVQTYDERRRFMLAGLRRLGFEVSVEPKGAFYVLADARAFSNDSHTLAFDILEKAHVAVTPGIDFGKNAEGFLRFSYANSIENIDEAFRRLERYIQQRRS